MLPEIARKIRKHTDIFPFAGKPLRKRKSTDVSANTQSTMAFRTAAT
jgi:hypothetical protein